AAIGKQVAGSHLWSRGVALGQAVYGNGGGPMEQPRRGDREVATGPARTRRSAFEAQPAVGLQTLISPRDWRRKRCDARPARGKTSSAPARAASRGDSSPRVAPRSTSS